MSSRLRFLLIPISATALAAACANGLDEKSDKDADTTLTGGGGSPSSVAAGPSTTAEGPATTAVTVGGGGDPGTGGAGTGGAGTGGAPNNCAHDVCTAGIALTIGCGDMCVDTVCALDSYCCDTEWDSVCVDEAVQLCMAACVIPVMPGDLVITEIMNNPGVVADNLGEWLEVYNDSFNTIDLQGFKLRHQANDPNAVETISQSIVLLPGDYAVLGINSNTTTNGGVTVDYQYGSTVNLSNTADFLAIEDANNTVIDDLSYTETSGLDPNGKSRNLDPLYLTAFDNDTDANFCEATTVMSGSADKGTPKGANDACPP